MRSRELVKASKPYKPAFTHTFIIQFILVHVLVHSEENMPDINSDTFYDRHVSKIAKEFINKETGNPYTTRGVLKWAEKLGFSPNNNQFTARQHRVLQSFYNDVILGGVNKDSFLQTNSQDLSVIWDLEAKRRGDEPNAAPPEPEKPAAADDVEDGLYGAIAPYMDSARAELGQLDQFCNQFEDKVAEATVSRLEAMPSRIFAKTTKKAIERQQLTPSRRIGIMGAIHDALSFRALPPSPVKIITGSSN